MTHSQFTSFSWSGADQIRDTFQCGKHQHVILPLTVFRRIDQVCDLAKEQLHKTHIEFKGKADNPGDPLRYRWWVKTSVIMPAGARASISQSTPH